jgi:hypothetical protein
VVKKKIVLLSLIFFLSLALSILQPISAVDQTNGDDETITVQKYSGGFTTYLDAGSFNASAGNWVAVYLSTSSSNSKYNEIEVQVVGDNSGIPYDATAASFAQTFQIKRDDTYKITIIKLSPFYDDLTVSGEIIVHHYPMPLTTNLPSLSPVPALTPSPSPIPSPTNSASPTPLLSPSPTNRLSNHETGLLTTNFMTITSVLIVFISLSLMVFFKLQKR